ncbi:MAG: hypothetical protein AABY22_03825 [Nanoarchaeota archaeon]
MKRRRVMLPQTSATPQQVRVLLWVLAIFAIITAIDQIFRLGWLTADQSLWASLLWSLFLAAGASFKKFGSRGNWLMTSGGVVGILGIISAGLGLFTLPTNTFFTGIGTFFASISGVLNIAIAILFVVAALTKRL